MNVDGSPITMDGPLARELLAKGAVLIIAGVPVTTEFGIDLCSYTVGEKFRGVKMIPPGPHFVWCAAQGLYGDAAPRVGFVHYFKSKEIVVREWDKLNEELRERQIADPELERRRIAENLLELDSFLAPYDYRYFSDWKHLTDAVTEAIVLRCRPSLGVVRTNVELQSCPDSERPRGPYRGIAAFNMNLVSTEEELLPNLKPIEGTAPRYTELPERVPKDAQPADITRHSIDCIAALDVLISNFEHSNELIEEIELAFVLYLVGNSVESLAQWRKLLHLLAHSEAAVSKYKLLYMKYSEVLAYQLPRLPEELMEPNERNTVYKDVRNLLVNLSVAGLFHNAERLSKKLFHSMQWKFEGLLDDDPDEQPVIVETV